MYINEENRLAQPVFKGPGGQFYTQALFYEMSSDKDKVLYTLKDDDHLGYPSIKRLYIEEEDEYTFANKYLHSWNHFKMLSKLSWFAPVLQEAREELRLKIESREISRIKQKADMGDIKASQYLLEQKWKLQDTRGRPSKSKIKEEASKMNLELQDTLDDFNRLFKA